MPESLNETISNLCTTMKLRTQDMKKIDKNLFDNLQFDKY